MADQQTKTIGWASARPKSPSSAKRFWSARVRSALLGQTLATAALLGLSGCATADSVMLLDQVCKATYAPASNNPINGDACTVAKDARETTGLTGDSLAFRLGPSTGELRIRLDVIPAVTSANWAIEVLAASSRPEGSTIYREINWGSCKGCPSTPKDAEAALGEEFEWVRVIENQPAFQTWSSSAALASDSLIIFRGADIDIVDIRTPGYDNQYGYY